MRKRSWLAGVLALGIMLGWTPRGDAETVSATGAQGTPGIFTGIPGDPGGDGGSGGDANATADDANDPGNTAEATGGVGGQAANGVDANTAGSPGGAGGDGGKGGEGNASATTNSTSPSANADAIASGGAGGEPGLGGSGNPAGASGSGGSGGAADAAAVATSITRAASADARSFGGDGGSGGNGGDANSRADAVGNVGVGSTAFAIGGDGGSGPNGGDGGHAVASASSRKTGQDGWTRAGAGARGGNGGGASGIGRTGGIGGTGSAHAGVIASKSGTRSWASTNVMGGDGGVGSAGAHGGRGGDAVLQDKISGTSDASTLSLGQSTSGGDGGSATITGTGGMGGRGGDATSSLDLVHAGSAALVVFLNAAGGDGGDSSTTKGRGGNARVGGSISNAGDVELQATARGGRGGSENRGFSSPYTGGAGGLATIDPLHAASTNGGRVRVSVKATHGLAGNSPVGLDGADIVLVDRVSGTTAGQLSLFQEATAGDAGGGMVFGVSGAGGNATSSLDHSGSHQTLDVEARATGGRGGYAGTIRGNGGNAAVFVRGSNSSGTSDARGSATGGRGGDGFGGQSVGGQGGEADLELVAETIRDGDDVLIGTDSAATGGLGSAAGRGGHAVARTRGEAFGNSRVDTFIQAVGGWGGNALPFSDGGRGGDAHTDVSGRNAGDEDVSISGHSVGGRGGFQGTLVAGRGGDATGSATAHSSGGGDLDISLSATGGDGGGNWLGNAVGDAGNGGDAILQDPVSFSTTGDVAIDLQAKGGLGGTGSTTDRHGRGGNATASADVSHLGGGDLALRLSAAAGGWGGAVAGRPGGNAFTSGTAVGQSAVTVDASVSAAPGGTAVLGPVAGRSLGGGDVFVRGLLQHGDAYQNAAKTGSVLVNAVDGNTSGALTLEQLVWIGYVAGDNSAIQSESSLSKTVENASIRLLAEATDGAARANVSAVNRGGDAHAEARAHSGDGADASTFARAESLSDGSVVTVGVDSGPSGLLQLNGAHAGGGGPVIGPGNATSHSEGLHRGDGQVDVRDFAFGGSGFSVDGGAAASTAIARGAGRSLVEARATAGGGRADGSARAGGSRALAIAGGLGAVGAHATIRGDGGGLIGEGTARAIASGSSGEVSATAFGAFSMRAASTVFGNAEAEAHLTDSDLVVAKAVDAYAVSLVNAGHQELAPFLQAHSDSDAAVAGMHEVLGLGRFGSHHNQDGTITFSGHVASERQPDLLFPNPQPPRQEGSYVLALLGLSVVEQGFAQLHFQVLVDGVTAVDVTFTDALGAMAWFDDKVLNFGSASGLLPDLDVLLDVTSNDTSFGMELEFVLGTVPEPAILVLLALAFGLHAMTRRRRC